MISPEQAAFESQFSVTFLATWTAYHYDEYCFKGMQEELAKPPVEDAHFLARKAWQHQQFIIHGEKISE